MYREKLAQSSSPLLDRSETSKDTKVGGWVSYTTGLCLAGQAERQLHRYSPAENNFRVRTLARPLECVWCTQILQTLSEVGGFGGHGDVRT